MKQYYCQETEREAVVEGREEREREEKRHRDAQID